MHTTTPNDDGFTLLDHVPAPVLVVAADHRLRFLNRAARQLCDLGSEAAAGLSCHQVLSGCDCPGDGCPFYEAARSGREAVATRLLFAGTPREGRYEIIAVPVADGTGPTGEVVGVVREAVGPLPAESAAGAEEQGHRHLELQRLFGQVQRAKQEWERAMDCIGDMVILLDSRQRIRRCNKALADLAGRSYPKLLGQNCWELFDSLAMTEGEPAENDLEVHHPPSGRFFHFSRYPLQLEAVGFSGEVLIFHDVTLTRQTALALEVKNREMDKARRDLRRALDEVSIMIERIAEKGEFDLGFDLPPNLGQCWKVLACDQQGCPCYGREPLRCWQVAGTRCGGEIQGAFAEKIGECGQCGFYQEATSDPVFQVGEEFNHMMFILAGKNQELQKAYEELKASQTKLLQQEKMASIGQLAAGVAHEINNPMGFITSNLGSLAKYLKRLEEFLAREGEVAQQAATPEQRAELERLRKELKVEFLLADGAALIEESLGGAGRVRAIVQNLKSFSRVDQAAEARADINQCLEETLTIIWNELKYKCEVRKEYGELPLTRCYPQQLNQVFMNLLMNAAQAIEEKGTITIRTWAQGEDIRVAIGDSGCGIPADKIERIFEPFFTTKEVGKGTGLGLSITYDIVKKHQGRIEVESEPGKGTLFTVSLPVVP